MYKPRVAVLRGGISNQHDRSMQTGVSVLGALAELRYPYKDIVITRSGQWLVDGRAQSTAVALTGVDVVFNALHGSFGEDGEVQRLLSHHHLPYTGSRALGSATAYNKMFTKKIVQQLGVATPRHIMLRDGDTSRPRFVDTVHDMLGEWVVIKPVANGSSIDTHVGVPATEARSVAKELLSRYDTVLLEEHIRGRECSVGIIENARNQAQYLLPVVEIIPTAEHGYHSYEAKCGSETQYECPGRFSNQERDSLHAVAQKIHAALDLRHYSQSDFIVRDGQLYFLEINTQPALDEKSHFTNGLNAVGLPMSEFVALLISQAAH